MTEADQLLIVTINYPPDTIEGSRPIEYMLGLKLRYACASSFCHEKTVLIMIKCVRQTRLSANNLLCNL